MHIGIFQNISIGTKQGSFSITNLLTCDITFVFYDGMAIEAGQRHGEQR
jgi:hypothetical protein